MKSIYKIVVEGCLHEETTNKMRAYALRDKFEAEGWSVRIIELRETVIGLIGVER